MQKSLNLLLILIASIGIYTSCAKKTSGQKSKVKFKIQMSIVSDEYPGGVYIWGNQPTGDEHFSIVLSDANENEEVELDSTKEWDFFAIGWIGSEALTGTNICGLDLGKNFSGASETVTFDFNENNCDHSEISASEYLEGNQFLPIKFVTCNTIENVVAGGDCDTLNGDFSSFKIKLLAHNSNQPGLQMEGLNSECLNLTSGSFENSTFKLPAGGLNSLGLWYEINGYTEVGCVGDKKVFHLNKGLNKTLTSGVKVFADSGYTEVFLLADGNGESLAAPNLDNVSPNIVSPVGGETITLAGSNFESGATVTIGESSTCEAIVLVDANHITCTAPANEPGVYNITITNLNGQTSTLNSGITYQSGASISLAVDGSSVGNSFSLGSHPSGVIFEQPVTITNDGTTTINSIGFPWLETPFEVLSESCGSVLLVGDSCDFLLRFSPTEVEDFDTSLQIDFTDEFSFSGSANVSLTGHGVQGIANLIFIGTNTLDFGVVQAGNISRQYIIISNNGNVEATALQMGTLPEPFQVFTGDPDGNRTVTECGSSLAAGENCSIGIEVNAAAADIYNPTFTISYIDGQDPGSMPAFNLTANVIPGPLAQLVRTDDLSASIAGAPLNLIIALQDSFGNQVTNDEQLTLTVMSGPGSLLGSNILNPSGGVVHLQAETTRLNVPGLYSLRITTGEGISLDITSFTVNNP